MTATPVGRATDRVEGRSKVTGAAPYSADYKLPGTLHAHVVTSAIARGTIRRTTTAAAAAAPGVLRVYTAPEPRLRLYPLTGQLAGFTERYAPLQDAVVRFHGQIVAVVVAESVEQARDAAALVRVDDDVQPARTSLADEPRVPAAPAPDGSPSSFTRLAPGTPSIDAALAASDVVVEAAFHQPVQHHVAMEPHSVLATWEGDRLTLYAGAQLPAQYAQLMAARLGVLAPDVRLITTYVGGAFGARVVLWSEAPLAAAAARELGRPVLLTLTREQMFTITGHRSHVTQTVRLGASRDGVLRAVSHECDAEAPAVGGAPLLPAHAVTDTLYGTPNLHIAHRSVVLDLPGNRAMRGPNESPGAVALETAMDELAVATGVDPVELRLRNEAPVSPRSGLSWSSRHLSDCFRIGAQRFGWSRRTAVPRSHTDRQWLVGTGTAAATYPANRNQASVRVRLLDDDTATISTATADLGTGSWTMVAISGADALGIPLERVLAEIGDTALPPGAPAIGSSATSTTVALVVAAARDAVTALKQLAATDPRSPWHGTSTDRMRYARGHLHAGGRSMSFGRLLTALGTRGVDATASGERGVPPGHAFHSFGAHFCEVRVHRLTGETRVTRFTTVMDIGRVLNAQATRSQLVGGIVFGIGHALLEDNPLELHTGRLAASNLGDYLLPVNADVPDIDVHWLDRPDPVLTGALTGNDGIGTRSLGARGAGEIGNVGSAAAVANAVHHATGTRVRDLPITLDKLLAEPH